MQKPIKLENNFEIRFMERSRFFKYQTPARSKVFPNIHAVKLSNVLTSQEVHTNQELSKSFLRDPYELYLGLFSPTNEFIGWSFGVQTYVDEFYMCNSGVFPEYRKQGFYTKLMQTILQLAIDKGFQIIYSRHTASNNAVLIPKLKAGFTISSMEVDDVFGTLLHLRYYTNPLRRKIIDYRTGFVAPDAEVLNAFK